MRSRMHSRVMQPPRRGRCNSIRDTTNARHNILGVRMKTTPGPLFWIAIALLIVQAGLLWSTYHRIEHQERMDALWREQMDRQQKQWEQAWKEEPRTQWPADLLQTNQSICKAEDNTSDCAFPNVTITRPHIEFELEVNCGWIRKPNETIPTWKNGTNCPCKSEQECLKNETIGKMYLQFLEQTYTMKNSPTLH